MSRAAAAVAVRTVPLRRASEGAALSGSPFVSWSRGTRVWLRMSRRTQSSNTLQLRMSAMLSEQQEVESVAGGRASHSQQKEEERQRKMERQEETEGDMRWKRGDG